MGTYEALLDRLPDVAVSNPLGWDGDCLKRRGTCGGLS